MKPNDSINKEFETNLQKLNIQLQQFAKDLFKLWDINAYGKI